MRNWPPLSLNRLRYSRNESENQLADDSPHGFSDIWLRLSRNFTPESALFRHAVRMSLVLCVGYAIIG